MELLVFALALAAALIIAMGVYYFIDKLRQAVAPYYTPTGAMQVPLIALDTARSILIWGIIFAILFAVAVILLRLIES